MPLIDEDNKQPAASEKPNNNTDAEYMLKGVQAFSVGIALLAASVAVAHAVIAQIQSDLPLVIKIIQAILFMILNIAISTFGCIGIFLGLGMTGLVQMKGPIKIFDWGITTTWIVLTYVIAKERLKNLPPLA